MCSSLATASRCWTCSCPSDPFQRHGAACPCRIRRAKPHRSARFQPKPAARANCAPRSPLMRATLCERTPRASSAGGFSFVCRARSHADRLMAPFRRHPFGGSRSRGRPWHCRQDNGDSDGRAGISRILARWTEQAGIHPWRGAVREEAEHCFRAALRVRDARFVPRKRRCDVCKEGHGRRPRGAPFRLPGWQARRSPMRGLACIGSGALSHVPHEDVLLEITRANPYNFPLESLVGDMDVAARAVRPDRSARASGLDHPDCRAAALRGSERDPERTSPSMIVGMRPLGLSARYPGSFKPPNRLPRSRLLKALPSSATPTGQQRLRHCEIAERFAQQLDPAALNADRN
jgi:hypothetical protein